MKVRREEIGFVQILDDEVVLVAQDQKIDIRTGAKLLVGSRVGCSG